MRPKASASASLADIHGQALVEMRLGVAIGAITFTGSVIAFLKLDGRMSGKPIMLPMRHVVNAAPRHRARRADRAAGHHRERSWCSG